MASLAIIYCSSSGVLPRPLIRRATSLPSSNGISFRMVSQLSFTISADVLIGPFQIPGSPCIPMPIAISFSPSSKFATPFSGMIHGVNAKPTVRVLSFAFCAAAYTSSRVPIARAFAPAALYMKKIPATPRRTFTSALLFTSSAPTMLRVSMSSISQRSEASSNTMISPV